METFCKILGDADHPTPRSDNNSFTPNYLVNPPFPYLSEVTEQPTKKCVESGYMALNQHNNNNSTYSYQPHKQGTPQQGTSTSHDIQGGSLVFNNSMLIVCVYVVYI